MSNELWLSGGLSLTELIPGAQGVKGQHPRLVVLDEAVGDLSWMAGQPPDTGMKHLVQEAVREHSVTPTMPPHAGYGALGTRPRAGDMVVITGGEQYGWRGRVPTDYEDIPASIPLTMTRPDGSGAVTVVHRIEYVAKVLAPVPTFDSQEDAEAWLTANDRELRPAFVPGQMVRIRHCVSLNRLERRKNWTERFRDVILTAKVLGSGESRTAPVGAMTGLAYKVMTMDLPGKRGEPYILWVEADRIESG